MRLSSDLSRTAGFKPFAFNLTDRGDAGPEGLSEKEVLSHFGPKQLLEDRIEDLLDANLAYESGSSLQLTTTGQLTVFLLTNLRKILGLPPGQG